MGCEQRLHQFNLSTKEFVDDIQHFTRRRPEVVYGGLFIAGLAAMRFLKASKPSKREYAPRRQPSRSAYGQSPKRELPTPTVAAKTHTPSAASNPQASQS